MTYLKHHEAPSLLHDRIRCGGKPGGTDGPYLVPVELGILSDLLGPSLSVVPVLPEGLHSPSLHSVQVSRKPEEKIL